MHFVPLKVTNIVHETDDAYTIEFARPAEGFDYLPGQYLTLKVEVAGEPLRRAFSLSSCPLLDDHLAVTIKAIENGRVSQYLRKHLQIGDQIEAYPPMGNFTLTTSPSARRHYILIGAGSGITPLMSMLRAVLHAEPQSVISLVYGNRDEEHIIFNQALLELEKKFEPRLRVYHVLSRPSSNWRGFTGRIDEQMAHELLNDILTLNPLPYNIYLCGPQGMMDAVDQAAHRLGVDPNSIHREYYSAPIPQEAATDLKEDFEYELKKRNVRIVLDGEEYTLTVDPESNILQAAIDQGLDPPYACQEGVCSTCRGKLHSGLVQMMVRDGLSDEELEANYILTCQSVPLTDDVLVEFA